MLSTAIESGRPHPHSLAASSCASDGRDPGQYEVQARMPPDSTPPDSTRSGQFEHHALPLLSALYNHACWLTRDPAEAEDLVQETLTKALRAFDTFQPGTNFKAWIYRILRNTFLSSRTAIASTHTVFLEDQAEVLEAAAPGPSPEDILIRLNDQAAVFAALEQLPPHLRDALLLSDVDGLKYKDIAQVLGLPIGTVMSRLHRARVALRHALQSHLGRSA